MRHLANSTRIALGALALVAAGAATTAHAGTDVFVSFGLQGAPAYPVYSQPQAIYVAPQPVYYDRQGSYRRNPNGDYDGDGIANRWDPNPYRYDRTARHQGNRRDLDRDGIPNRYDRDRDGDGVRNQYDRAPNNAYRY